MGRLKPIIGLLLAIELIAVAGALIWQWQRPGAVAPVAVLGCVLLLLQGLVLWRIKRQLLAPLASLERGTEIILKTHAAHDLELPGAHWLGQLPGRIHELGDEIARGRSEISAALRTGAERAELQRQRLEQVIQGLEEGVIVCDADARILLYNPAAHRILGQHPALGLGRMLYDLLPRTPIEHTLDRIRQPDGPGAHFTSAVHDRELLLNCRIGLLRSTEAQEDESGSRLGRGFVVTFDDVTARQLTLARRDRLFSTTLEALRRPLANLRSAAEACTDYGDMGAEQRRAFVQVISEESHQLSEQVAELARNERTLVGQKWQLGNIYSADLIHLLTRRLAAETDLKLTMTGIPRWLTTDSYALVALLEHIARFIADAVEVQAFDLEASDSEGGVYLDLSWEGRVLTTGELEACRTATLTAVVGKPTADELLQQLGSELWSQLHPRLKDRAMARLPLPAPDTEAAPPASLPTRPMIYDFNLFEERDRHGPLMERPLRSLDFVVFDTETTGLHPEAGDEVVSIAAVRIVNQRILPDENFDQLVNPGRPIPRDSIRYHGITDEQVKDAPSIVEVLPHFKAYAKDAVLVAHNAWFDLAFIRRREAQSGAYFTNPILDTLMLSVCLHGQEVDQSLDGIARRLGIDILGRHSALGDSLATARILLSQIELLEARGIITLRDALEAYR